MINKCLKKIDLFSSTCDICQSMDVGINPWKSSPNVANMLRNRENILKSRAPLKVHSIGPSYIPQTTGHPRGFEPFVKSIQSKPPRQNSIRPSQKDYGITSSPLLIDGYWSDDSSPPKHSSNQLNSSIQRSARSVAVVSPRSDPPPAITLSPKIQSPPSRVPALVPPPTPSTSIMMPQNLVYTARPGSNFSMSSLRLEQHQVEEEDWRAVRMREAALRARSRELESQWEELERAKKAALLREVVNRFEKEADEEMSIFISECDRNCLIAVKELEGQMEIAKEGLASFLEQIDSKLNSLLKAKEEALKSFNVTQSENEKSKVRILEEKDKAIQNRKKRLNEKVKEQLVLVETEIRKASQSSTV